MESTLKYKKVNRSDIFDSNYQYGIPFNDYEKNEISKLINLLFPSYYTSIVNVTSVEEKTQFYQVYKYGSTPFTMNDDDLFFKLKIYKIEDEYYGAIVYKKTTHSGETTEYFIGDQFDGLVELIIYIRKNEKL